jgi:site-specific recombinase XerD
VSPNQVQQGAASADFSGRRAPCAGPLATHLEGFIALLTQEGYSKSWLYRKGLVVRRLSSWLVRQKLTLTDINERRLRQFQAYRGRHVGTYVRKNEAITGRQLLGFLRDLGCVPGPVPIVDQTELGKLTRDFEVFLQSQRGLAPRTVCAYVDCTRRLLAQQFRGRALSLQHLRAPDVDRFILREARRVSRRSVKKTLAALRGFLRHALQRGAIKTDLAVGLPKVAVWRFSDVPKSLPPDQVERLLSSCNCSTAAGQRDHAILLLLSRLGLRAAEVGALRLEDVDWDRGEIVVRAKRQRIQRSPLPKDVGAALAQYLREARPRCHSRTVFIRQQAPWRGISPSGISQIVRRALKRAGLKPERTGAHLLRHSLATNMLRRGASLREIGQLLGHDDPTTTQIYAKVDIEALRAIARPWMGGAP